MKKIAIVLTFIFIMLALYALFQKPKVKAELGEEISNQSLETKGSIPDWLAGTLVRNGPVYVTVHGKTNAHWFDGLAMLHAFSFQNGQVWYSNRFLRTDAYKTVFEKGSLRYAGFASDPCRSIFKRLFTHFVPHKAGVSLPNANVNVAKIADEYVALTETPLPVHFDPQTLETLGVLDYQDQLPHERSWESAHPHHDAARQETLNYLVEYGRISKYVLYRIKEGSSAREIIAELPVEEPSYMHSFSVTENYVIFTEYPFVVNPLDLIMKNRGFITNFIWDPERGTQFIVIARQTGEVVGKYKTAPFFSFHHANAFEEEGKIVLDIICYEDPHVITELAGQYRPDARVSRHLGEHIQERLERFTLTLNTGEIKGDVVFKDSVEFPRINDKFDGKPYRYLYLVDPRDPTLDDNSPRMLYKVDRETKESNKWSERACYPGEPVFVPSPQAKEEDEGVILAVVLNLEKRASFLLVLDGKTFKEIGRAEVMHAIPPGLHGQYFQDVPRL